MYLFFLWRVRLLFLSCSIATEYLQEFLAVLAAAPLLQPDRCSFGVIVVPKLQ